jgi:hypothetical protein
MRADLALAAALALVPAAGRAGPAAPDPAAAVLATVRALDAALVRKDTAALEALLAPDFIGATPTGAAFERAGYIAFHCSHDEGLVSVQPAPGTAPVVRLLGKDAAVVNRRVAVRRRGPGGEVTPYTVQRIEVLVLQGGAWRIASGQGTRVAEAPPPGTRATSPPG